MRAPRLKRPEAFGDLFTDDKYERVSRALGKAYRDVVRGFRGEFENPPDLVALPARLLGGGDGPELGRGRGRRGDPLRRRHQRRRRGRAAARRAAGGDARPAPARPPGRSRPDRLAARIEAGATGPRLEEQLREHGLTMRCFPQSFEYATLGGWIATRAGGHFATKETHVDDLVESVRAVTPRGTWESRRLPGSGAGPSPDRMLLGCEGILGVITEAWVRVRPRPEWKAAATVALRALRRRLRGGPRDRPGRPRPGQLPPPRSRRGGADRRRRRQVPPAAPRPSSPPTTRSTRPLRSPSRRRASTAAAGRAPDHRPRATIRVEAEPRSTRRRIGGRGGGRVLARGVPARAVPAGHVRRLRGALGDLRDGDHLGPAGGVPRDGDGDDAAGGRRGLRGAARGPRRAARHLPLHPRLPRRRRALLHGPGARRSAAARSSSGTRSRPPSPRR